MTRLPPAARDIFAAAERDLLAYHDGNRWFTESYWPGNRDRLVKLVGDALRLCPPAGRRPLLDIGCGVGYMSYVFAKCGYAVTGADMYDDAQRDRTFKAEQISFVLANFNDLKPLAGIPDGTFDLIICGEVIEHILTHPLGFVREMARVLRPGGHAILTTPNPATLMNAVRVLRNRHSLWGTQAFADDPKVDGGAIISRADIHYREYTLDELTGLLERGGFEVVRREYIGSGANSMDGPFKRFAKRLPLARWAMTSRLLATGQYQVARKR